MSKEKKIVRIAGDFLFDVLGSFLLAVGIYCFSEPCQIAPGGVSGIAIMIKHIWGLPVGIVTFIINIPLMILAVKYMGKKFAIKTINTLIISTIVLDFFVARWLPQYQGDRLMGSLCGGLLMGTGLALVFLRGSTTAGTDIVSYLLQLKFPHNQIGRIIMLIDCIILAVSVLVFGNFEAGLFGVAALFCQTKVIDGILYGVERGTMITVMSSHGEKIAERIIEEMDRTATLLKGQGAYSKQDTSVLICVVRKQQFAQFKKLVYEADPNAFIVVTEAEQILGEGFTALVNKEKP